MDRFFHGRPEPFAIEAQDPDPLAKTWEELTAAQANLSADIETFAVDKFEFAETQEIANVTDDVVCTLPCKLVILAHQGWQSELSWDSGGTSVGFGGSFHRRQAERQFRVSGASNLVRISVAANGSVAGSRFIYQK